ncbi:MAG TPA: hypothetical protein VGR86_01140 [Steroidobacteraceae bacterium]|nr:hypothetical protein [Steroidobacteraceae bacterium]
MNSLPRDARVRWFSAVKKLAKPPEGEAVEVAARDLPDRRATIEGGAALDFVSHECVWLSFVGTVVFDAPQVELTLPDATAMVIPNCADGESLQRGWPTYEASPKHRLEEYCRGGVEVSEMDLPPEDAQAALLVSLPYGGARYVAVRGKVYRFMVTHEGGARPIYHGHRLADRFVPPPVRALLDE